MAVPTQRTWVVGEKVTAAFLNANVRDAVNFLLNPPAVLVYNGAIAIPQNVITYATFASERYDTENMHSTTTTTGRLTCVTPGIFQFDLYALYAGAPNGQRSVVLRRNGTTILRQLDVPENGGGATAVALTTSYKLDLNDYVELGMYQEAAGPLNCTPEFGMTWVGVG